VGRLHDLLAEHLDAQPYPVSQRQLAHRLGVAPSTIDNWRRPRELVAKEHLVRIAEVTGLGYTEVLEALLHDIGYLHAEQEPVATPRGRGRGAAATAADALREARARAGDRPPAGGEAWHSGESDTA
jgi:transcriptional regulator with XRE-family HTH domain